MTNGVLTAPKGRFGLVQSSYEFGHMGTNYNQDPENVSKLQQCVSYASCDETIKNRPCKVGLSKRPKWNMGYAKSNSKLMHI